MFTARSLVLTVILCLLAGSGLADVPGQVSFQGVLQDSGGEPLNGVYSIRFSIYDSIEGGLELWSENRDSVAVVDGAFSVLLGDVNPLDESIFSAAGAWIGVAVGADAEMTPRQEIATAPYAFRSSRADTAEYAISATVGYHTHDNLYVSNVGPDTMFAMSAQPTLAITNSGTGAALLAAGDIVGGFDLGIAGDAAIAGSLSVGDGFSTSGNCIFDGSSVVDFESGATIDFTGTSVSGLPSPPHDHDDVYISKDGPDTIRSFGTEATLTAINAATGRALSGINTYISRNANTR